METGERRAASISRPSEKNNPSPALERELMPGRREGLRVNSPRPVYLPAVEEEAVVPLQSTIDLPENLLLSLPEAEEVVVEVLHKLVLIVLLNGLVEMVEMV